MLVADRKSYTELYQALKRVSKDVPTKRHAQEATRPGGEILVDQARAVAETVFKYNPDYEVHYYKDTAIKKGHTAKAIQTLLYLRKTHGTLVGPRITGKAGTAKKLGFRNARRSSSVDAFYAQMIFGSARAFGQKIMDVALSRGGESAANLIIKEADKIVIREFNKNGFR